MRKNVLAEHVDLTLTKLYNVLEALLANLGQGRTLSEAERDIHERGLVTLIRRHHVAIDEAVTEAYGWATDYKAGSLDDETVLARLVAINRERAVEETNGMVRYLRPEFQDPGYTPPIAEILDFGETALAFSASATVWPKGLTEQVSAFSRVLTGASETLSAQDIARIFKGKRAATIRPVLQALTGVGLERRTADDKYAA